MPISPSHIRPQPHLASAPQVSVLFAVRGPLVRVQQLPGQHEAVVVGAAHERVEQLRHIGRVGAVKTAVLHLVDELRDDRLHGIVAA